MGTNKDIAQPEDEKFLSSIGKNNPFSAPGDYFEHLPGNITDKVQSGLKEKQGFVFLKPSVLIPSFAILSGLIFFFITLLNKTDVTGTNNMLLSENEVRHIIEDPELYNIDEADITDEYIVSNVQDEPVMEEANLPDNEVKAYLEENTDIENIINEY